MKQHFAAREVIRARLDDEVGTIRRQAPRRVALVYPSPYHVGMSSLGFQAIYRVLNADDEWVAERAFLPDDVEAAKKARAPLCTYESETPVAEHAAIAFSVAYELEVTGLFDCLELAGLPLFSDERDARHPLVIGGGPLTFSNPLPLGPFVDVVVMGEAEQLAPALLKAIAAEPDREKLLSELAKLDGYWVPKIHGEHLPQVGRVDDEMLPAYSQVVTPHTELRSMFLVEPERGCSRGCTYCVMRRSTNGGMRLVPPDVVMQSIPEHARRVGLVGAAVTDHPQDRGDRAAHRRLGREVGISSLRADRLTDELVGLLGARRLSHADHGVGRRERADARDHRAQDQGEASREGGGAGARAPDEGAQALSRWWACPARTTTTSTSCIRFARELSKLIPLALGVAPFVAKRNTPLDGTPFAGIERGRGAPRASASRSQRRASRCAPPPRAGRGSSTCSRKAARAPGCARSKPIAPAADSRPGNAPSPTRAAHAASFSASFNNAPKAANADSDPNAEEA